METVKIVLVILLASVFVGLILGYIIKKNKSNPYTPKPDRPKQYLSFLENVKTALRGMKTKTKKKAYLKSIEPQIEVFIMEDGRFLNDFYDALEEVGIDWYEV